MKQVHLVWLLQKYRVISSHGITKPDCYIVSFDESLNDITQTC